MYCACFMNVIPTLNDDLLELLWVYRGKDNMHDMKW
jgi:hypothetical protein